jgi:hypothetical protein
VVSLYTYGMVLCSRYQSHLERSLSSSLLSGASFLRDLLARVRSFPLSFDTRFFELLLHATCCHSFISFCLLIWCWGRSAAGRVMCRGRGMCWNATSNQIAHAPIQSPMNGQPTNPFRTQQPLPPPPRAIHKHSRTDKHGLQVTVSSATQ